MKISLRFIAAFLFAGTFMIAANAQYKTRRICFFDEFGGKFNFPDVQRINRTLLYAEGTYDGYPNSKAKLWLDVSRGANFEIVEVHVANGKPDGCNFYSDSFTFRGVGYLIIAGRETNYFGAGTWESYCYGDVLGVGTWSAFGPCSLYSAQTQKKSDQTPPYRGAGNKQPQTKHDDVSLKIVPNPMGSNTTLQYKINSPGKINITVYDIMQQPVRTLVNEYKTIGDYTVSWDGLNVSGSRVSPGLYQVVIRSGQKVYSKMLQVR